MRPINIAVIDSGITAGHDHVGALAGGVGFRMDERGGVAASLDFIDRIGHGTAVAGVIREKNPAANLFALKIFHDTLTAPAALLLAAMDFAIRQRMDIIHLSLGTRRERCRDALEARCRTAQAQGIVVVSSAKSPADRIYPSVFDCVIGVCPDETCREDELIHHPDGPINFSAHGRPRALPGLPQEQNFQGASFAAARVTARLAQMLSKNANPDPCLTAGGAIGIIVDSCRDSRDGDSYPPTALVL